MSEILIIAVQECSALGDMSSRNYHNPLLSYREWEEVAKIIDTTTYVQVST